MTTIISLLILFDAYILKRDENYFNDNKNYTSSFYKSSLEEDFFFYANDSDNNNNNSALNNINTTMPTTSTTTTTTTKTTLLSTLTINTTAKQFKWNHCGQTHIQPSVDMSKFGRKKRIVGGEDALEHSWPFLVSIRVKVNKSDHHCGGTLITDQHVITAAHCLFAYFSILNKLNLNVAQIFSLIEVRVGQNEHEKDPQYLTNDHVYSVVDFDFHENFAYNEWTLEHDIAILKLKRKVNLNRPEVNVVCLPNSTNYQLKNGENVVAIGWGSYSDQFDYDSYYHLHLQQAVFTVKDEEDDLCNSGIIGKKWNKNYTICADGKEKRKVTCFGDSGGPVMVYENNRWILIGIISFAHDIKDVKTKKKKCNASMPFYFVKVKEYFDWINQKTEFGLSGYQ